VNHGLHRSGRLPAPPSGVAGLRRPPRGSVILTLLVVLVVVLVLAIVAYVWVVPAVAESIARSKLEQLGARFGQQVRFERLEIVGGSHVAVHGLTVERDEARRALATEPVATIPHADIEVDVWSALLGDTRISTIELHDPSFVLVRAEDGTTDVDALIAMVDERLARADDARDPDGESRALPDIHIDGGQLRVVDAWVPNGTAPEGAGPVASALAAVKSPLASATELVLDLKLVDGRPALGALLTAHARVEGAAQDALTVPETVDLRLERKETAHGAAAWVANLDTAPRTVLRRLPRLKGLEVAFTGIDVVLPGTVAARGVEVRDRAQTEPLLIADRVEVETAGLRSADALSIRRMAFDHPRIVIRSPGPADGLPARLAARYRNGAAPKSAEPTEPDPGSAPDAETPARRWSRLVSLVPGRLDVVGGEVVLELGTEEAPASFALHAVSAGLTHSLLDKSLGGKLGFGLGERGRVDVNGRLGYGDDTIEAHLTMKDADLGQLARLSGVSTAEMVRAGFGSGTIDLERRSATAPWGLSANTTLRDLAVEHYRIALEPVTGLNLHLEGRMVWDPAQGNVEIKGGELGLGDAATVFIDGGVYGLGHGSPDAPIDLKKIDLDVRMKPTAAQPLFDAIPDPLKDRVSGMRFRGKVGFRFKAAIDARDVSAMKSDSDLELVNFGIEEYNPTTDVRRLNGAFTHSVVQPETDYAFSIVASAAEDSRWVPLPRISPFVPKAVLTNEDSSFYKHSGFSWFQVKASIEDNLEAGRFRRGASTLSMQLVKNVFLSHEKTLARKFQELLLTFAMESVEKIPKDRILEIYLNIIEWAPRVYGIRAAARHYFGRLPDQLTLPEAVYLITIIPGPRRYHGAWSRGEMSDSWWDRVQRLMRTMFERGHITQEELDEGLAHRPVFWKGDGLRPPPDTERKPAFVPIDGLFP